MNDYDYCVRGSKQLRLEREKKVVFLGEFSMNQATNP